jgi:hypothetical protein
MREISLDTACPGQETLWQIACDPARIAALHGLVGDFCHLLRNRLNSLQMGLYLARRGASQPDPRVWDELDGHYREAERVIDLFQTVCRPMPLTPIAIGLGLVLGDFAARWAPRFLDHGVTLDVSLVEADGPSHLDPSRLSLGLDALAAWRLDRFDSGGRLNVRGWVGQGRSRLEWGETGSRGMDHGGALHLAALARVATAHGGRMTREDRDGWRLRVDWPHSPTVSA